MGDALPYIVLGMSLLFVALLPLFKKRAKIRRKLRKIPLTAIRHARNGDHIRIIGTVDYLKEPLQAPVSGRSCAFYDVVVERERTNGRNSYWEAIFEEREKNPFVVRDGDRVAFVDTSKVDVFLYPDKKFDPGVFNKADAQLDRYLKSKDYDTEGFLGFHKSIRYREGVLEKGEKVCVSGKCSWKSHNGEAKVLVLTADGDKPVIISDDPKILVDEPGQGNRM